MSSLQDMSNFLFISMTGPKMAQHIQIVSILLHEAKPVLGLFCLHLNTIGWSDLATTTIRRDNLLGFKSLWLGFWISASGLWSGFSGSVFTITFSRVKSTPIFQQVLQPLGWRLLNVRFNKNGMWVTYKNRIYVAQTSNNRVILSGDLYFARCHIVKLSALAARASRLQKKKYIFLPFACSMNEND